MDRIVNANPRGTNVSRFLMALSQAHGNLRAAKAISTGWRDSPTVTAELDSMIHHAEHGYTLITRSETIPISTLPTSPASALFPTEIGREVLSLIQPLSVFESLKPSMRRMPFKVHVARELVGTSASWIGELQPIPIAMGQWDSASLPPYKLSSIVVVSQALLKTGGAAAEQAVRDILISAVARAVDQNFLDPTINRSDNVRPASVTNAGVVRSSSGS